MSGHETLKEVERYTKAANRSRLADSAMATLKTAQAAGAEFGKRDSELANTPGTVSQSTIQITVSEQKNTKEWRRGRDSNPRYAYAYSGFRDRPIQPL